MWVGMLLSVGMGLEKWDRGGRFKLSRPPRVFWWILGIALLASVALFLRVRMANSHGGWILALRKPIFYGIETASWWARAIPPILITILVGCGFSIWLYEHITKRRIQI